MSRVDSVEETRTAAPGAPLRSGRERPRLLGVRAKPPNVEPVRHSRGRVSEPTPCNDLPCRPPFHAVRARDPIFPLDRSAPSSQLRQQPMSANPAARLRASARAGELSRDPECLLSGAHRRGRRSLAPHELTVGTPFPIGLSSRSTRLSYDDSEADCPTYYGDGLDRVDLDRGLLVEPLDFAHPE
ncbi:uncharacterized protein M6B38_350795 [Iris pallida]|uniref:Uncharacterized protein n=1 Tax=Iris pallida TaxID=29817 RepID=A0AAX6GS82_IRIPA|nr:uncharacterized protein M6B38_350795 [Iris pallida]